MFKNLSNLSEGVDTAFAVILGISFIFLIAITVLLLIFIYKYNEKRHPKAAQFEGNNFLEALWTIIPIILVLGMFYYGYVGWEPLYDKPPKGAFPIKTVARMWNWHFVYDNGKQTDTLFVPQGRAVTLDLVSMDVIHSFYVPAFRIKRDIIPGEKQKVWFIANRPGVYDLFCAEYCGLQHSSMFSSVKVIPAAAFDKWYVKPEEAEAKSSATVTPAMLGHNLYQRIGCMACHSIDGSTMTGPTFKGAFGHPVTVTTNGKERTFTMDEAYVRHSILDPNADIVKGFKPNLMQTYKDQLSAQDIDNIIAFLKTLH
jgi:cytochrome c oxidase subunit 2